MGRRATLINDFFDWGFLSLGDTFVFLEAWIFLVVLLARFIGGFGIETLPLTHFLFLNCLFFFNILLFHSFLQFFFLFLVLLEIKTHYTALIQLKFLFQHLVSVGDFFFQGPGFYLDEKAFLNFLYFFTNHWDLSLKGLVSFVIFLDQITEVGLEIFEVLFQRIHIRSNLIFMVTVEIGLLTNVFLINFGNGVSDWTEFLDVDINFFDQFCCIFVIRFFNFTQEGGCVFAFLVSWFDYTFELIN